jgi:DNA primase
MIPIRDARGRTIAFGGRIIGDGEPKYLNSPETPLFDKGRTLYNLDRAQVAARKSNRVIVVEGYMDVIALTQAGFGEVVAPLGTALTEQQLERLWRMAEMPILAFDGDAAGQKAAIRATHRALPLLQPGRRLAVLILPYGQDPDDIIASGGGTEFDKILKRAIPLSEYIWRAELSGVGSNPGPDERGALLHRLDSLAETIADPILKTEYRQTFRKHFYDLFGLKKRDLAAVRNAVAEAASHPGRGVEYALHRAVLLGLMRYPSVLYRNIEEINHLPIVDRYLRRWRGLLIEIAIKQENLSEDLIDQILAQSDVSPIEARDLRRDLAFSFFRKFDDPKMAVGELKLVIEVLNEHHETQKAAKLAQKLFEESMTAEFFDRQQRTNQAAAASSRKLYVWLEMAKEARDALAA